MSIQSRVFTLIMLVMIGFVAILILISCEMNKREMKESDKIWKESEYTELISGTNYHISDFNKPLLIMPFSVNCTVCETQFTIIKDAVLDYDDKFIPMSWNLDIEQAANVRKFAVQNDFKWRFSNLDQKKKLSLKNQFGTGAVTSEFVPVILVCNNKEKLLAFSVKSPTYLLEQIRINCENSKILPVTEQ